MCDVFFFWFFLNNSCKSKQCTTTSIQEKSHVKKEEDEENNKQRNVCNRMTTFKIMITHASRMSTTARETNCLGRRDLNK